MKVPIEKPGTPAELVHYGKKGMRWGVRSVTDSGGQTTRLHPGVTSYRPGKLRATYQARQLSKSIGGFNAPNMMTMSSVHKAALPGIRQDLVKINRSPTAVKGNASVTRSYFQGALQRNHPARVKYDSQVESIVRKNYQNTINNTYGKKYPDLDFQVLRVDNKIVDGSRFAVKVSPKVRHADANENPTTLEFEVRYIRDKNGFVTGVEMVSDTIAQGEVFVKNALSHGQG